MLSIQSSVAVQRILAENLVRLRKHHRHSRALAAERSGVPSATIRRFETTGDISLRQFLMLCEAYGGLQQLTQLLQVPPARTLDELIARRKQEGQG